MSGTSGRSRLTLLKLMTMPVELPALTDMPMSVPGRGAAGLVSVLLVTVTSWAPDSSTAVPAPLPPTPGCALPLPKIVLFSTVPAAPTYDTPFCEINPSMECGGPAVLPDRFMVIVAPRPGFEPALLVVPDHRVGDRDSACAVMFSARIALPVWQEPNAPFWNCQM